MATISGYRVRLLVAALVLLVSSSVAAETATLTIGDCLDRARKNNHSLALAEYDRSVEKENVHLADSGYYPKIDLQAGYTNLLAPQAIKTGAGSFETQQAGFPFASIGLYQTLYDFGRRDRRKEQAVIRENAVSLGTSALRQDVALLVIRSYYGILESGSFVTIAREEVSQREQHLKVATSLYEEGVTTRNDLLQAEVNLACSRQRLLAENSRLANGWLLLNYLIGAPAESRSTLIDDGSIESQQPKGFAESPAKREELAAQKLMIKSAESYAAESSVDFYPELFLKASVDYLQNDKVIEQTMYGVTVGLKWNIFDGMATTSRERQAVKLLDKEKERLRGMEEAYILEIHTAKNDLSVAYEQIESTRTAIRQSEENLRINNDRYKAQVGTATDVIDAQTLLSQAKSDYARAVFDYQIARARIKRAVGEL